MLPSTKIILLQSSEMMVMPMLPMKMPKQLISADAEPVSSDCCSSIRFAPGVRTQLALIVAGRSKVANIHGWRWPNPDSNSPLAEIAAKQVMIIDLREIRLDRRIYSIGPPIMPSALRAK